MNLTLHCVHRGTLQKTQQPHAKSVPAIRHVIYMAQKYKVPKVGKPLFGNLQEHPDQII